MRKNKTLFDDVLKVYLKIPCIESHLCNSCKNDNLCKTMDKLLKSLRKNY